MHPDSQANTRWKTPVMAIVNRQNNPLGGDLIRLVLFGYYPNGGGANLDVRYSTDFNYSVGTAIDEMRHPGLETALRESLALHRLWDRWAARGRGLVLGLNCWADSIGRPFSPIKVEIVGSESPVFTVVGDEPTAEYHLALYVILRDLIREDGKW